MTINPNPHFTPDKPDECSPSSYIVCEHCRNTRICSNKLPYEKGFISITGLETDDPEHNDKVDIFADKPAENIHLFSSAKLI